MFDSVVKRGIAEYHVATFLLVLLLVILLWKIYENYVKPYTEFPTYPFIQNIVYCTVMNKVPKHLPFASFLFQEFLRIGKLFQKEGLVLYWTPKPVLFIYDADAVKEFSNDEAVLNKAKQYDVLRDMVGTGLLTSNGGTWKTHRKLLNPVFHVGMLKKKLKIFNKSAEILVNKMESCMSEGSIDVLELIKACALGNICEYALGLKMNIPENEEIIQNYLEIMSFITEYMMFRLAMPWLHFSFMLKFTSSGRKYEKMIEDLHSFTRKIISAMKESIVLQKAKSTIEDEWNEDEETRKSFAHILLDQHLKGNSFTMDDVQSQVMTIMVAGFENMSHALLWTLFMLGHYPEVQDQAYDEVDTLGEGNIDYDDLRKLKYLECVIKETLRIYPPTPVYARSNSKEIHCGKYTVPKGTDLDFVPYLMHRDPEVFPDPEKFEPNRFMEVNSSIKPGNYLPFATGIRNCIGKRFAMMEMTVILSYILRNFCIKSLDRREDVDLMFNMVLAPVKPLRSSSHKGCECAECDS